MSDICSEAGTELTTAECTLEKLLALRDEMRSKFVPRLYAIVSDVGMKELRRMSDEKIEPPSLELFGATVIVENSAAKRIEMAAGIVAQGKKCEVLEVFFEDAFGTLIRFPQSTTERR